LLARRGALLIAALGASQILLLVWLDVARYSPWPLVAVGGGLAVAALGLGALALFPRFAPSEIGATSFVAAALVALLGAQAVAAAAGLAPGAPAFGWLLASALALVTAELRLASRASWGWVPLVAALAGSLQAAMLGRGATGGPIWWQELAFALGLWLPFLAFPLLVAEPMRRTKEPYVALLLAGAGTLLVGRDALLRGELDDVLGLLPVLQAALLVPHVVGLARSTSAADLRAGRDTTRLALAAGGLLGFVTVAIPMQLEKQWITLGWALLGAALAWLGQRVPHPGLTVWAVGLELAAFVRLTLNPAVLGYHPREGPPILNWYLYTYLVAAGAMFLAARWLAGRQIEGSGLAPAPALATAATILLFFLLNIEIADFFSSGPALTFGFLGGHAGLPEDLAYTIGWALFAIGLLVAGVVGRRRSVRISAISLLAVTVVKAFLHDTWKLGGLYRVGSLVGLAVSLALVALVLQRFVLRAGIDERGEKQARAGAEPARCFALALSPRAAA
jgi:hypothetical protein